MYVLLVRCETAGRRSRIHLVDDAGALARSTATVQEALRWLVERDEASVVAMTDDGPELFLIEACEGLQLTLPSLSLRPGAAPGSDLLGSSPKGRTPGDHEPGGSLARHGPTARPRARGAPGAGLDRRKQQSFAPLRVGTHGQVPPLSQSLSQARHRAFSHALDESKPPGVKCSERLLEPRPQYKPGECRGSGRPLKRLRSDPRGQAYVLPRPLHRQG